MKQNKRRRLQRRRKLRKAKAQKKEADKRPVGSMRNPPGSGGPQDAIPAGGSPVGGGSTGMVGLLGPDGKKYRSIYLPHLDDTLSEECEQCMMEKYEKGKRRFEAPMGG